MVADGGGEVEEKRRIDLFHIYLVIFCLFLEQEKERFLCLWINKIANVITQHCICNFMLASLPF